MQKSESIAKIAAALVNVQAKLKPLKRNADNPFFKSSYTDLAALSETALPLLTAEGIAVVQGGDGPLMETMLVHTSGEWISTALPMPSTDNPQKLGSVVTYFRRYGLAAAIGAVSEGEDDDGNTASQPSARPASAPAPATHPPAESGARSAAPSPAPAAPAGGGPAVLTVVTLDSTAGRKKDPKTGEHTGEPWTRYTAKFSNGVSASTFDSKHGTILAEAKARNLPVAVHFEKNGKFTNITNVIAAGEVP